MLRVMSSPDPGTGPLLVVDDYESNRELVASILEREGYHVIQAGSGREALAIAAREPVELVLLDMRMPDMDGTATCRALRELPPLREVPIVFLTAHDDRSTHERALASGADDFLTKPVRATELRIRVRALLRLRRLTQELRSAHDVVVLQRNGLERTARLQQELAAFIVHDLKSPIGRILLATNLVTAADPQSRELLLRIEEAARTLERMVHGLLDVGRSEAEALPALRRPTDLGALCADVVRTMGPQAPDPRGARGAGGPATRLSAECALSSPHVLVDPDLLRRVLENLVSNAILYGPGDGKIRISAAEQGPWLEIRVTDEGHGIPKEEREKIFEKFSRVGPLAHRKGRVGHGLGLVFCKAAAQAHGGTIHVEDGPQGRGCAFVLRLPRAGQSGGQSGSYSSFQIS
jgi:two-component system sensor histidine kinase/response regulator